MATAYVTFALAVARDVFDGAAARSQTVTTSATAASTGLLAGNEEFAQVFCAIGVYASSETTVTSATGVFCPPNVPTIVKCTPGKPISLIDA